MPARGLSTALVVDLRMFSSHAVQRVFPEDQSLLWLLKGENGPQMGYPAYNKSDMSQEEKQIEDVMTQNNDKCWSILLILTSC